MSWYSQKQRMLVRVVTILVGFTAPLWVWALLFAPGFEYMTGLLLVPAVVVLNGVLILRASARDACLRPVLLPAYWMKLAMAGAYLYLVQHLFHGGDILDYHATGARIASGYLVTGVWPLYHGASFQLGTGFVYWVIGALYLLSGPSIAFGVAVFASVGFWGQYFIYRAFCVAFPGGNRPRAALMLLLLPSLSFWTAAIGKEALILFCIALTAYGLALLVTKPGAAAYVLLGLGVAGVALVRPHVAAVVGISAMVAYVLGRHTSGKLGIALKVMSLPVMAYALVVVFNQAQRFLHVESLTSGLQAVERVSRNTRYGPAAIDTSGSLLSNLLMAPFVLFRPFPWEIHNLQAGIAAAESLMIMLVFWHFRRDLVAAVAHWRERPVVLFIIIYVSISMIMMASAFSNIGLLARQRVMILPFALILTSTGLSRAVAAQRRRVSPRPPAPLPRAAPANAVATGRLSPQDLFKE